MSKEKNMKIVLTNTLLLMALLSSPRTTGQAGIEGSFCIVGVQYGYCLTLSSDNSFEYTDWSCNGQTKGKGTFILKNDTLLLRFISDRSSAITFLRKDTICESEGSIALTFTLSDNETNRPIPDAQISFINPDDSRDTVTGFTDGKGKVTLMTDDASGETLTIRIIYLDVLHFDELKGDGCKTVAVKLPVPPECTISNGTEWVFTIEEVNAEKLVVRRPGNDFLWKKTTLKRVLK